MVDTGDVDESQPAIQHPTERRQPPRPDAAHPAHAAGQAPGPDLIAGAAALTRRIRDIRLFRTSSAIVRWTVLVIAVGLGVAFFVALTIEVLVSLIPTA
jgi:hypothetical protein